MGEKKLLPFWALESLVAMGVVLLGTPLHYVFGLAGRLPVLGLVAPVNESAWEHFKMFYWPLLLLSLPEYLAARGRTASFFLPKAAGMVAAFAGMSLFFYVPRAFIGGSTVLGILSFMAGVL